MRSSLKLLKRYKRGVVVFILLLFAISLSFFLSTFPYLNFGYDFTIGFDSGKYIYDLKNKTSTSISSVSLWVEPGLNTNLLFIHSITNIDPAFIFKFILPLFVSAYFIIIVFLFTYRITKFYTAALFSSFYLASSTIFLNGTFDSFYRQIFGTIIFMAFFYFFDKFYRNKSLNLVSLLLLSILGAGIIMSHRAISLLFILSLVIPSIVYLRNKDYMNLGFIISIFLVSILISSVYWLTIAATNIQIVKDAIVMSTKGNTGGERVIKNLNRDDNQLLGYLMSIWSSFIPFLGIVYSISKKKWSSVLLFTLLLMIYIYIKATFSNRFLFNLEIFFSILAGYFIFQLSKIVRSKIYIVFLFITVILVNSALAYNISSNRVPYVPYETPSIKWVERNVTKDSSIIIAPDALSTILTSMGYKTSTYALPLEGDTQITKTEDFLAYGYKDLSLIKNELSSYQNVYVIFGEWNVSVPFARTDNTIPLDKWDSTGLADKLYEGDPYILRVYKIKI